jgi:hypothetical protein
MIKIITLNEDDILFDAEAAGKALDKAARRLRPVRFTGVCPIGRQVLFVFNECSADEDDSDANFVFSRLPSRDFDEVSATILSRFTGGFDTLGTFSIGDDLWGLFKRLPRNDR